MAIFVVSREKFLQNPLTIFALFAENQAMRSKKSREEWKNAIKDAAEGKTTQSAAAEFLGITRQSVCQSVAKYRKKMSFSRSDSGCVRPRKFTPAVCRHVRKFYFEIKESYRDEVSFSLFRDVLRKRKRLKIAKSYIYKVMAKCGISSKLSRKRYVKHKKQRARRERFGELVQFDATKYDFFRNGHPVAVCGAIDDATGRILALRFCENESRLGYGGVLSQIFEKWGVFEAAYTDRSSAFVVNGRKKGKSEDALFEEARKSKTWFHDVCGELGIRHVLARSPQAKGRVERLWESLQCDRLAFFLFENGATTIKKANAIIWKFIAEYNRNFAVQPQKTTSRWQKIDKSRIDEIVSIKEERQTDKDGFFDFFSHRFLLDAPRKRYKHITLYVNEKFGIKAKVDGKFFPVRLAEPLSVTIEREMSDVMQDLVWEFLSKDTHETA